MVAGRKERARRIAPAGSFSRRARITRAAPRPRAARSPARRPAPDAREELEPVGERVVDARAEEEARVLRDVRGRIEPLGDGAERDELPEERGVRREDALGVEVERTHGAAL